VTDAQRPKSEDIAYRQRRYLISMGIRVVAFLLAVFLFHGVWRFAAAGLALVVPYFAVVFANGGREPESGARFETFRPRLPAHRGEAREAASPRHAPTPSWDHRTGEHHNGRYGGDGASHDAPNPHENDHAEGQRSW
jgi:Protein of unknown function (DUF3099)